MNGSNDEVPHYGAFSTSHAAKRPIICHKKCRPKSRKEQNNIKNNCLEQVLSFKYLGCELTEYFLKIFKIRIVLMLGQIHAYFKTQFITKIT